MLYECLTGERPVERDLDPEAVLGSGFGIVIAGLVAPEPDDRYRSAAALMEDLARLQLGEAPLGSDVEGPAPEPLPFVGRIREMSALRDMFTDAQGGWGSALRLRGARGGGKSRLVRELARAVAPVAEASVYVACEQQDPRPVAALRATVAAIVASVAPHRPEVLRRAAGGDLAPVANALCPALGVLVDAPAALPVGAERFAELATELLARLTRELGPDADRGGRRPVARSGERSGLRAPRGARTAASAPLRHGRSG